jgi:hypothetical protein
LLTYHTTGMTSSDAIPHQHRGRFGERWQRVENRWSDASIEREYR